MVYAANSFSVQFSEGGGEKGAENPCENRKKGELREVAEGGIRERKGSKREPKGGGTFQWQAQQHMRSDGG